MIDVFKSKKFWWSVTGFVAVGLSVAIGKLIGLDDETTNKVALAVAAFFSLAIGGHILTDIVTIIKGLQQPRDG